MRNLIKLWLLSFLIAVSNCSRSDDTNSSANSAKSSGRPTMGSSESNSPAVASSPQNASKDAPVARLSMQDTWLDLLAQRPNAVRWCRNRIWINLGRLHSRSHIELDHNSGWELAARDGDTLTGFIHGRTATLNIPLDGSLAPARNPDDVEGRPGLAMAINVRAIESGQTLTVLWNEKPLANLQLSTKWERRTLSLPRDNTRVGENQLRFHFRKLVKRTGKSLAGMISTVEVGRRGVIVDGAPDPTECVIAGVRGGDLSVELPNATGLAHYVMVPRRGKLLLSAAGSGQLELLLSSDQDHKRGREPTLLSTLRLKSRVRQVSLDLSGYVDIPIRIMARVSGGEQAKAKISSMGIASQRSVPVDRRQRSKRHLFVIGIEGARSQDVLSNPKLLPHISRLFAQSLVFSRAYSLGSAAVPSHAGWLSSIVPPVHLTVSGTFVAQGQTMFPELLVRAGYFTANVTANTDLDPVRGLTQGFRQQKILGRTVVEGNDGPSILDASLEQIRGVHDRSPVFSYSNLNDPQTPYDPPLEKIQGLKVPHGIVAMPTRLWVERVKLGKLQPNQEQLRYVRRLYVGELQVVDDAVGQLLQYLEDEAMMEQSIVVLLGLHGEEFHEHGGAGHGHSLYEESIHVPLAIAAPGLLAPGRVEMPVDMLDLAPTLVDLLGLEYPSQWQGESLLPYVDDPIPSPKLVISYLGDGSRAAIVGDHKLILGPGRGTKSQQYFNLKTDPGEHENRLLDGGIALRMLRSAMTWQIGEEGRWRRARWGTGVNLSTAFSLDHGL